MKRTPCDSRSREKNQACMLNIGSDSGVASSTLLPGVFVSDGKEERLMRTEVSKIGDI